MTTKQTFILLLIIFAFSTQTHSQKRETTNLNTAWKFSKGHNEMAHQKTIDDSNWQQVIIPHDWAIAEPFIVDGDGNTGKLPWKGEGWYRKNMTVPPNYEGK